LLIGCFFAAGMSFVVLTDYKETETMAKLYNKFFERLLNQTCGVRDFVAQFFENLIL
jgi:hypothetical protein